MIFRKAVIFVALIATSSIFLTIPASAKNEKQDKIVAAPTITVAPFEGSAKKVAQDEVIKLNGSEFEIFILANYIGEITWDVAEPNGGKPPVKTFDAAPKTEIIGFRVGEKSPNKYTTPNSQSLVVFPDGKGRAIISSWGLEKNKPKKLTQIIVESNGGSGPGPGPIPPDVLPEPTDVLWPALKAAYLADPSPTKNICITKLAGVYRKGANEYAYDTTLTTNLTLYKKLADEASKECPLPALRPVREIIATELDKVLGVQATIALNASNRQAAASQFNRISALFDALAALKI